MSTLFDAGYKQGVADAAQRAAELGQVVAERIAELEQRVSQSEDEAAALDRKLDTALAALALIARSGGFREGTSPRELQTIARTALEKIERGA